MKKDCVKAKVYKYLDTVHSPKVFHGWDLQHIMLSITQKNTYPSTLLDYVRDYADETGSNFVCLDKNKSKYKFERVHKYGNSIRN